MAAHCNCCSLLLLAALSLPFFFFFFFFVFHSCTPAAAAAAADQYVNNHSFLKLSRGLNLSILPSYNASTGDPLSRVLMSPVSMPIPDEGGFFFPILSSPSFNSTSSSSQSRGFSLGFYLLYYYDSATYNIYLAVCAGLSGNYSSVSLNSAVYLNSSSGRNIYPYVTNDGSVVPVWIANVDKPIGDWSKASLGVVADSSSSTNYILQLKDGDEIVWNASNVGMMEMRDSGDLLMFNDTSPSTTNVVWQSSWRSDTLVEGQKLTVGGELRSNDSNYLARMEKGGLVLYLNNGAHFGNNTQPPPYWILPILGNSRASSAHGNASINELISTAPCSNSPAFTVLDHDFFNYTHINLDPGSCNLSNTTFVLGFAADTTASWRFLRLENDGRLYVYTVNTRQLTRVALDSATYYNGSSISIWQWPGPDCGVPMACGPVGVCTSGAITRCSCPNTGVDFDPVNSTDLTQGCKRRAPLPECTTTTYSGNEHIYSTSFTELDSTATTFLFNGWSFNPNLINASVAQCESLCSSNCSCHGFFYQVHISACFFISDDEFTLLKVVDKNLNLVNYTSQDFFPESQVKVLARNYVTYLKVVSPPAGSDSNSFTNQSKSDNKSATTALIVIVPTLVACLVVGMACISYRLFRSRKLRKTKLRLQAEEERELHDILPLLPNRFSYRDLHEATNGFKKLLGAGGCGSVYMGILWDGRKIAVKVLQVVLQGAEQSRQFLAEVGTIGRTNHQNIVRLYGFCWELSHRMLVYEYVERGSLDGWLFVADQHEAASPLDWPTRYSVALGIGRGMHYLHEQCEPPILHFDIKPQNILLGDDFVAKLADFGMSRLIQRNTSSLVTGVLRGTPGYIAPEWLSHGKVSKKSDIFSMGMVLLELVAGRKILDLSLLNSSLDSSEQEAWHLPSWAARTCEEGSLTLELVDKHLHVCGFDAKQAQILVHIAFWCILEDPAMRPSALTVVQWLEGISPKRCPPFSTVINAALSKPLATKSVYDESDIDHISMF